MIPMESLLSMPWNWEKRKVRFHLSLQIYMHSLPKAFRAFFDGISYEDVVQNAVSLGGDTDTLGATAGAIGEAYYGVPDELRKECCQLIPTDMIVVLKRFEKQVNEEKETDFK